MKCKDCNRPLVIEAERDSGRCFLCLARGNLEWWENRMSDQWPEEDKWQVLHDLKRHGKYCVGFSTEKHGKFGFKLLATDLNNASAQNIIRRLNLLEEAMQEFVDRCDRGEVRSTYTYNKFKGLLDGRGK